MDRQLRFAAGVTRDPKPFLSVSLSCSYTALGSAHIEKFLGPIAGRLADQYGAARLPFVSLSLISIHLRVLKADPEINVHLVLVSQPARGTGTKP